jgi:hypothetical protein
MLSAIPRSRSAVCRSASLAMRCNSLAMRSCSASSRLWLAVTRPASASLRPFSALRPSESEGIFLSCAIRRAEEDAADRRYERRCLRCRKARAGWWRASPGRTS